MEYYTYLVDIQALDRVIKRHLDEITAQEDRLVLLTDAKSQREEVYETNSLEKCKIHDQQITLEKELFDIDQKIKNNQSHLLNATSEKQVNTLEHEVAELNKRKDALEDVIIQDLDKVEELEKAMSLDEEYFTGIDETIKEISVEVQKITNTKQIEIGKLEKQIDGLISEIPSELLGLFNKTRERYRFKDFVATLNTTTCSLCKYQTSPVEAEVVTKQNRHMLCGSCKRILINKRYFS